MAPEPLSIRSGLPVEMLLAIVSRLDHIQDRAAFSLALPPLGIELQNRDAAELGHEPEVLHLLGMRVDAEFVRRYVRSGLATYAGCERLVTSLLSGGLTAGVVEETWGGLMAFGLLVLPRGIVQLPEEMFDEADSEENRKVKNELMSVALPPALKSVGESAFFRCARLRSLVNLPRSLKEIGDSSFFGGALRHVDMSETAVEKIGPHAFEANKTLSELNLPYTLREIGFQAFFRCCALTADLHFSSAFKEIGYLAFFGCALRHVDMSQTAVEVISNGAFSSNRVLMSVELPRGLKEIGDCAFSGCALLKTIDLSQTEVATIGNDAFLGNKALQTLIPNTSLKSIGRYAFNSCSLEFVDLSETSVEKIGFGAFAFNMSLSNLVLPSTLKKTGKEAFSNCPALTEVIVPTTTYLGDNAFPEGTRVLRKSPAEMKATPPVFFF